MNIDNDITCSNDGCLKEDTINERALGDDFIPLAIETYGCLHSRFDSFLTTCA
jgi:hypothetical protein